MTLSVKRETAREAYNLAMSALFALAAVGVYVGASAL